ncbi:MAG: metallophosphoesterase family protein [Hyphomonadaceae bacterium]
MAATTYFAIGDVHGEAQKLRQLHQSILDRIAFDKQPACIIHLGDFVDRGPDSHGVVEAVLALEALFAGSEKIRVVSLMGNHEQMMLDAYDSSESSEADGSWWAQGGAETADSYAEGPGTGGADWRLTIPAAHITWMRRLPLIHRASDQPLVFVHAGIEPASFPNEPERTYLWTRSDRFFEHEQWPDRAELQNLTVVHGHTPRSFEPEIFPHRINVDTGACFGGPLTAVMLKEGTAPQFLRAL